MKKAIIAAAIVALAIAAPLNATAATVVVTPSSMGNWTFYSTDNTGALNTGSSTGQMVTGPASPPLGTGSANFQTSPGNGDQSEQLRNTDWAGTLISQITTLSYSTYASSFNGSQLPFLNLYVDTTGGTTFNDRLWFEPTYSSAGAGNVNPNPAQPDVAANTWQTWDARNGMWYTDSGDPAGSNPDAGGFNGPGSHAITLDQFIAAFPNARIVNVSPTVGGIRFASGFSDPSDNYNTNIDNFSIGTAGGTTTYDFEPNATSTPTPLPATFWTGTTLLTLLATGHVIRKRTRSSVV